MLPLKTKISIKNIFLGVALKLVSQLSIRSKNNCTNFGLFLEHLKKKKEKRLSSGATI